MHKESYAETGISPLSCSYIEEPSVSSCSFNGEHYCLSTYTIKQEDTHASKVFFKYSESDQFNAMSFDLDYNQTKNYVVTPSTGSNLCVPTYKVMRSYCVIDNLYSSYNSYLRGSTNYVCSEFKLTNKTSSFDTISTLWDQSSNVWDHGGAQDQTIYFSLSYLGAIWDGHVTIGSFTGSAVSATLNGVTFYVRTGPNRISVKASQAIICNSYDTMFAFYTHS